MAHPAAALLESLRPLHRAEYDRLVALGSFDDARVELLCGVLASMSPQGAAHADLVCRLAAALGAAIGATALVRTHSPLALGDDSEPEPDVAVVPPGDYSREHPRTALLLIEVSDSSLQKDRELKAPLYAAARLPEYWLVNLVDRAVEVYRAPMDGRYTEVTRLDRNGVLRALALPDVDLPVAALLG